MLKLVHLNAARKKKNVALLRNTFLPKTYSRSLRNLKITKLNSLFQTKVTASKSREVGTIGGNNIKACEKPGSSKEVPILNHLEKRMITPPERYHITCTWGQESEQFYLLPHSVW